MGSTTVICLVCAGTRACFACEGTGGGRTPKCDKVCRRCEGTGACDSCVSPGKRLRAVTAPPARQR